MPLAARLGDMTSHGTPLVYLAPPAVPPTVFIGGKPVWRAVVDFHACPQLTALVPHVAGAVAVGSKTVFINGQFAVRQGDAVVEAAGPPNTIAAGCPTVLIGG
jgi:uncharacterized Zn-binding protein involved in type VI secretion